MVNPILPDLMKAAKLLTYKAKRPAREAEQAKTLKKGVGNLIHSIDQKGLGLFHKNCLNLKNQPPHCMGTLGFSHYFLQHIKLYLR